MSSEDPDIGVDPPQVGPPDLILQEIVAPREVPEEMRDRFEARMVGNAPVTALPVPNDARQRALLWVALIARVGKM